MKIVKPIGIYAHNGLWDCPAFSYTKKKTILLRVDRILSLEIKEKDVENELTLEQWFNNNDIKNPIQMEVFLTKEGIRKCKGNSWLEEHIIENSDGTGCIDMIVDKNELNFIASFFYTVGNDCEIKQPKVLIDLICNYANEILKIYRINRNR